MKIKFPKHQKNFKKKDLSISPGIYWKVILLFAFLVILTSCLFGLYLFFQVNKEVTLTPEELGLQTKTIKKDRIDNILKYFSEREQKSNEILSTPSPIVDPSI